MSIIFVLLNRRFIGGHEMKNGLGLRSYAIVYLIFLYAPIIILPMFAFNDSKVVSFPLKGFTTKWFAEMWADPNLHDGAVEQPDHRAVDRDHLDRAGHLRRPRLGALQVSGQDRRSWG